MPSIHIELFAKRQFGILGGDHSGLPKYRMGRLPDKLVGGSGGEEAPKGKTSANFDVAVEILAMNMAR